MSKEYWHTKTLFIQAWKYKWSYKFNYCIKCWTCNHKHKWNWLCTSCWDKERDKTNKRKEIKQKAWKKWHKTNYIPVIERKKRVKTFDAKTYKKEWRIKNKEALLLKAKAYRMVKKGINCMQININWKYKYLPFETLEEPKTTTSKNYDNFKQNLKDFNILKKYYYERI